MGSPSLLSPVARRLSDNVALITGGASGIGKSTAKLFTQHSAKVVIADIQDDLGHSLSSFSIRYRSTPALIWKQEISPPCFRVLNTSRTTMGNPSLLSPVARRLSEKVALITGGASGIGRSTAKLFTQHGAKVIIADIQDDLGHSLCKEIDSSSASYVHCDVTDENQVKEAVDTAISKYGKLDIMFNNAGYIDRHKARIQDNEKADFERVLSTNVTGVFLCTKHAARVMIPARRGSIISTSSMGSVLGGFASHAYTCSKHAVLGITRNTAVELGQFGIRVNCISPYSLWTPMAMDYFSNKNEDEFNEMVYNSVKLRGVTLEPEDIAQAALYLGSDDSKYVSGINLVVDGGFTAGSNSSSNLFNLQTID